MSVEKADRILVRVCAMQRVKPADIILDSSQYPSDGYEVLPLSGLTEIQSALRKHYSLKANEYLNCHWERYKEESLQPGGMMRKKLEPIHYRDYHFCNGEVVVRAADSLFRRTDFRMKLVVTTAGYLADQFGMKLTPQELMFKRPVPKAVLKAAREKAKEAKAARAQARSVPIPTKVVKKQEAKREKKPPVVSRDLALKRPMAQALAEKASAPKSPRPHSPTTTIEVTKERTVKVDEDRKKVVVQKKCTVAVHNQ